MKVKTVVKLIKISGQLTSTWPPDPGVSLKETILRETLWCVSLLNVIALLVPLVLAVYHNRLELSATMKSLSELTALGEVLFNLILCKFQRRRFQALLSELTSYVKTAETSEIIVLQKYSDRYLPFLITVGSSYIMTAVVFSCAPFIISTSLPADAWYPFPIESFTTRCSLYVLQVLAILQTGLCITVDFMVGMMLWYAAARLEMLVARIEIVDNEAQLNCCIEEHQKLIAFVRETCYAVRFIILKGNVTMAIVVICGGFPLIHHEPLLVISQFVLMVVGGLLRLYVTAWPADDLSEMSEKVALSVYRSHWVDGSREMRKTVIFTIQRSRKPLVISVRGVLPALTLRFYASFVSSTLSYFMTMRAIFGN